MQFSSMNLNRSAVLTPPVRSIHIHTTHEVVDPKTRTPIVLAIRKLMVGKQDEGEGEACAIQRKVSNAVALLHRGASMLD